MTLLSKIRDYLDNLIDRLIPQEILESDHDLRRRSRLLVGLLLWSLPMGPAYALVFWLQFDNIPMAILLIAACSVSNFGTPIVFRLSKNLNVTTHLFLVCTWLILMTFIYQEGGLLSVGTSSNLILLPILGVMLAGTKTGLIWCLVSMGSSVLLYLGYRFGVIIPKELSLDETVLATMISFSGTSIATFMIVNLQEVGKAFMLREVDYHQKLSQEAHQRARLVLDNVDQGFVIVERNGSLNKEYSNALETIVGPFNSSLKIWEYLAEVSKEAAGWLEISWHQLEQERLPAAMIFSQIPKIISCDRNSHYLSISCQLVEKIDKVLLMVTDITEKVKSEKVQEQHNELFAIVFGMVEYGKAFFDSFDEMSNKVDQLISDDSRDHRQQKVLLHTIKGSALALGMISLPRAIHDLEQTLATKKTKLSLEELESLRKQWHHFLQKINPFLSSRGKSHLEVNPKEYEQIRKAIDDNRPKEELLLLLDSWLLDSTLVRLRQLGDHAQVIASRLNKPALTIKIEDNSIRLDRDKWRQFWNAVNQAVRNAVDHGIESEAIRLARGKSSSGTLILSTRIDNNHFIVTLEDDGQGIDWQRIREQAKANGLPYQDHQDLIDAMFSSGLTTKSSAELYSGRGVGTEVLKQAVKQLDGSISVHSQIGSGTKFEFIFPLDSQAIIAA